MKIKILFFAALKDQMGMRESEYEFETGKTVSEAAREVLGFDSSLLFAVNDELVERNYALQHGDLLAFIPPMAGG